MANRGPQRMTRRAALQLLAGSAAALATAGAASAHPLARRLLSASRARPKLPRDIGMMGTPVDMRAYMELFERHTEIRRTVDEVPGGVRTVTESNVPELAAKLKEHVAAMYVDLDRGAEVTCMSSSLPILFRHASGYRRELTLTATGAVVTETSTQPALVKAIRAHAREVTGFVREGMPAMMRSGMTAMMGGR